MTFFDMLYDINDIMYAIEDKLSELRHVGEFEYEIIVPNEYTNKLEIRLTIIPYNDGEDEEFDIFSEDIIKLNFERNECYISTFECVNDYSECIEILKSSCEKIREILMNEGNVNG